MHYKTIKKYKQREEKPNWEDELMANKSQYQGRPPGSVEEQQKVNLKNK